ncbi:hypothetical protein V2W45_1465657 [Cenococcum geophilum]
MFSTACTGHGSGGEETRGSQLAVLPEYHLTSCVPEHPDFIASYAESPAQDLNIHIVPGTIVELSNRYRPPRRERILTAGRHTPHIAFDVPLPRNGTMRGLAFPEAFREPAAGGAQVIVLALNLKSEVAFLDSVTVARAYENTCASHVAMPIMGCLGKLGVEKGDMITSEVDLDMLRVAEEHYKVRADL